MDTATLRNETTSGVDLPQLVAQGRAAYEHKRTKECLELARQVLHSDPENADAKALQAAVSTDIQRDLTDARALLEDAERMEDGHKYRKAAEIILLKILYLDPAHIDAKALLATAKASTRRSSVVEEIGFTAHPEPVERKPQVRSRSFNLKLPLVAARHCPSRRRVMVLQIASARHGRRVGAGGTGGHFGRASSRNYRGTRDTCVGCGSSTSTCHC